jgi:RNA-binding protein
MINSKQRAYLKSIAHKMKPLVQLGKEGISEGFIAGVDDMLEKHELVKVSILESFEMKASDAAVAVMEKTGAEFVQAIGNRFTIFRRRNEKPTILFPEEMKKKSVADSAGKNAKTASGASTKRSKAISRAEKMESSKKSDFKKPKIRSLAKSKAKSKAKGR